ncbi:MAG: hypothetical protein ACRDE9_04210, partial [Candidatus Limnocylindria bacterium]
MRIPKLAAVMATCAIVLAACQPSASAEPSAGASAAAGGECIVGVSWNNFQQPRWAATDKPNMQETIEAGGGTFIDAD